jgi:Domain of unknown function (DUF5671)
MEQQPPQPPQQPYQSEPTQPQAQQPGVPAYPPAPGWPPPAQPRRLSWVGLLYFYAAALIGLITILVGALIAANALIDAIFFEAPVVPDNEFVFSSSDDRGDKFEEALRGLVTAAIGFPIFWWHIRQARRQEGDK